METTKQKICLETAESVMEELFPGNKTTCPKCGGYGATLNVKQNRSAHYHCPDCGYSRKWKNVVIKSETEYCGEFEQYLPLMRELGRAFGEKVREIEKAAETMKEEEHGKKA